MVDFGTEMRTVDKGLMQRNDYVAAADAHLMYMLGLWKRDVDISDINGGATRAHVLEP